jgi:hypothetical protein
MRAEDQFHVGIVAEDFDATRASLSTLFGYQWCPEIGGPVPVRVATGDTTVDLRCVYSRCAPRLEIVRAVPGTVWVPAAGSGIHHVGYWSDDVAADSDELNRRGYMAEAAGVHPDGTPFWAYHRSTNGPRVELVARALQPAMEEYWATPGPEA